MEAGNYQSEPSIRKHPIIMTNYCPNCNQEFAPDDLHCSNCGTPRPTAIHKTQTVILSQRTPVKATSPSVPFPPVETTTAAPVEPMPTDPTSAVATEEATAPIESPLPTFWICAQCHTANPSSADYCENCGGLNPGSQPTERQAESNGVVSSNDSTVKLPTDLVAALAAHSKPSGWRLVSGNATDVGLSRQGLTNEDSHFVMELRRYFEGRPEAFGLYIVADGMGGQAAGEIASRMAIESVVPVVVSELVGRWTSGEQVTPEQITDVLRGAVSLAHTRLRQYNDSEGIDSGTTMTACCILPPLAIFANVGDSRTYLFRQPAPSQPTNGDGVVTDPMLPLATREATEPTVTPPTILPARSDDDRATEELSPPTQAESSPQPVASKVIIERVTRDQSLVQHLMEQGEITQEEVYTDPRRNVILFALGAPDDVPVDTYQRELQDGDTIVLCSDGLWEMVRDEPIAEQTQITDLQTSADKLVALANENGGADNITVVVVRAEKQS